MRLKQALIDKLRAIRPPDRGEPYPFDADDDGPEQFFKCGRCERRGNYHTFWVSAITEENTVAVRDRTTNEVVLIPACPSCMHKTETTEEE